MNSVCRDPYKNNSEQMQASWKIRPMRLLKCYQEDLSPVLHWLSDECSFLYKEGVCCNWTCQLLLTSDKMRGTQGAAQVSLKDSISYDRKRHHPLCAPHFPTSAEINDASFADSCCLGCSRTLPGSALIMTLPLPSKLSAMHIQRENWWGKVSYIFQWLGPYFVFSVY